MPVTTIWEQVLARIETKVNRHSFYTWFKPTSFVSDSGQAITVRVPNTLFKDWLTKHYSGVLLEALGEVKRGEAKVHFVEEGLPDPSLGADEPPPPPAPEPAATTGA
jgi:chromosomal replication initiator protein